MDITNFSGISAYYNGKNTFGWTNTLARSAAFPVEKFSVFGSLDDAQKYVNGEEIPSMGAAAGLAYAGQIIAVANADGSQTAYLVDPTVTEGDLIGLRPLAIGGDAEELKLKLNELSSSLLSADGIIDQLSGAIDEVNTSAALSVSNLSVAAYTDLSIALSSEEGEGDILKTYTITQGGREVGKIDIPKDLVIEAAGLVNYDGTATKITVGGKEYTVKGTHEAGEYIVMITAVSEDQIWIPVKDLIDTYVGGETTTITVGIERSGDEKVVTASIKAGSITKDLLSSDLTAELEGLRTDVNAVSTDLNEEITRAKASEEVLSGMVEDEVAARVADDTYLSGQIDAAVEATEEALDTLRTDLAGEIERATGKEGELETAIGNEETRAKGKEGELETAISNEETRAKGEETILSGLISAEETRAKGEESTLSDLIEAETARAEAAEEALSDLIEALSGEAGDVDSQLCTMIQNETQRALTAESNLETLIGTEETTRIAQDEALQANIDALSVSLEGKLNVETTAREAKDAELTAAIEANRTAISTEETRAKGVEDTISGNVIAEETRATGVEEGLQSQIDELSAGAYDEFETKEDAQAKYNDLSGKIKTEADARAADDDFLSGKIDETIDSLSNYALSADVTAIRDDLDSRKLDKTEFAQISNDIGLSAASTTNKVVTQNDIKGLSGAMILVGKADKAGAPVLSTGSTASLSDLFNEIPLGRTSSDPVVGDVVIQTQPTQVEGETVDKEFVWTSQNGGQWNELGSEGIYATKVELEEEAASRTQGDIDTLASAKEYADSISTALSTDYSGKIAAEETSRKADDDFLSGKIDDITDSLEEYALSADVTAIRNELTAANDFLSGKIDDEVARAEGIENELSTKVEHKVWIKDAATEGYESGKYSDLSVIKITEDEYMSKVADGTLMKDGVLYVISSDHINAYGQKIVNVAEPTVSSDAATKNYVDVEVQKVAQSALSAIELNGLEFSIENNRATLNIDVINCGTASV